MKFQTTIEKSGPRELKDGEEFSLYEEEDGSMLIVFSESFIEQLGWNVGDVLEWTLEDGGIASIKKVVNENL